MISESAADYHANPAISHSKLECYRRRPALFQKRFVLQMLAPPKESNALRIGNAAHCAILEEKSFLERYVVMPDIDRRTKEGKAMFAEFAAQNAGKTYLAKDELDQLMQMRIAVDAHPVARELMSAGQPEVSWRTPDMHGLRLQCRTDWWNAEGCEASKGKPYVVDIKTVESLDRDAFRNFERAVFSYGYHRQAGFYLPLINELYDKPVSRMYYVAVEKVEPYGVGVYRLSDEAIGRGMDENTTDLLRLKKSFEEDDWPNIEPGVRELGLPAWYGREAT